MPVGDHAAQLTAAREQMTANSRDASLDTYEALVNAGQGLPEVIQDLTLIAGSEGAVDARVNRLLGDALMAEGKTQEAIDAYRGALDKL